MTGGGGNMLNIGATELLLIIFILCLLFGAHKIPELARSLGRAIGEFKKARREVEIEVSQLEQFNINKWK